MFKIQAIGLSNGSVICICALALKQLSITIIIIIYMVLFACSAFRTKSSFMLCKIGSCSETVLHLRW